MRSLCSRPRPVLRARYAPCSPALFSRPPLALVRSTPLIMRGRRPNNRKRRLSLVSRSLRPFCAGLHTPHVEKKSLWFSLKRPLSLRSAEKEPLSLKIFPHGSHKRAFRYALRGARPKLLNYNSQHKKSRVNPKGAKCALDFLLLVSMFSK